jgi:hypothetical protein
MGFVLLRLNGVLDELGSALQILDKHLDEFVGLVADRGHALAVNFGDESGATTASTVAHAAS